MHPAVAQSLFVRRPSRMAGFVVFSVCAHLFLAAALIAAQVFDLFGKGPEIDLQKKPIQASLVRLGKERDKKLLPRKEEPPPPPKKVEAPPAPVPTPPKPEVAAVPIPGVKPKEPPPSKQAGAKTDEPPRKRSLADAFSSAAAKPTEEELEGASDGDPLGDSAIQEGERYFGAIKAQIRRYYDVSDTISEQERMHLRAEVFIRVSARGDVLNAKLARASGNDLFDSAVLAAANKASPFAPPPPHLKSELEAKGILLEFRP